MRGARPQHHARNMQHRVQARRQAYTVRSATNLNRQARQDMQQLTAGQLREWRPGGAGPAQAVKLEPSQRQEFVSKLADLLDEAQNFIKLTDMGQKDVKGVVEAQFEMPRDIDGNAIYLDGDRPYIHGPDSEKIYVKVFRARIKQSATGPFGGVCTPANPDGSSEALLVEPIPEIRQGE